MKNQYNRSARKRLRELAGISHERELAGELKKLHDQFKDWQAEKIDVFELNDRIHHFHQKTAREIWKMYSHNDHDDLLVSRAFKLGFDGRGGWEGVDGTTRTVDRCLARWRFG